MRTYFVRLRDSDLTLADGVYRSALIDLYDNSGYKNFSVTRSLYGLNNLGNGTWTGIHQVNATTTDSGVIEDGRFIDTTGRIDIVSWNFEPEFTVGEGPAVGALTLYTADSATAVFPDEFVRRGPYSTADPIEHIGAPRYLRAEVVVDAPEGSTFDFDLYLRVEIDIPVMAPRYRMTGRLLENFPQWMGLREYGREDATPELATPTSLGSKLLNSIAGEWLEDLSNAISYADLQKYIDSADLNQLAWVWRQQTRDAPFVLTVYSADLDLNYAQAADQEEFYAAVQNGDEAVYFWDENEDVLYLGHPSEVSINEVAPTEAPVPHHIWNTFDDIGYTVDLKRHRLEGNDSFRKRILDVYRNQPGVGLENFKKALRRELNIWKAYGATPNSDYLGATPEVLELADLEIDPLYMSPDGMPTQLFVSLVDQLAIDYPTTWGKFRWDRTYWDLGGLNHEGYKVLPYRMDATPLVGADIQSGVGDIDDLLILRPDAITGPHDFTARLIARGRQRTERTEYPPVQFDVEVYGINDRKIYNNPSNSVWLTLDATVAGVHYYHSFLLTSKSDVDVDKPTATPASYATYRYISEDGASTDDNIVFAQMTNGAAYNATGTIPLADITNVVLRAGKWDVGSQGYTLTEGADTFDAWFSHDTATVLTFNAGTPTVSGGLNMPLSPVVMRSKQTSFVIGPWESEHFPYTVRVNTASPPTTETEAVFPVPDIMWDPYEEDPDQRQLIVKLVSTISNGELGGVTVDESGAPVDLDTSYIYVQNGSSIPETFPPDGIVDYADFNDLSFHVEAGDDYPLTATVWDLYEQVQTTSFSAIVDENGPWRYGVPSAPGNTNFVLQSMEVDRNDFGIPNTDEYVITQMSVEVLDDPRVIAWLDSNTVKPAVTDATDIAYPSNAIVEELNGGVYTYTPFVVRARLQPQPSPEWNPYIHSGWYFQGDREGYVYADPVTLTTTGATRILSGLARQGAPIIVYTNEATPREMRQVAFMDDTGALTLTNTQIINGSGINRLYLAYDNVYDATVTDVASGQPVDAAVSTTTNELITTDVTDRRRQYLVTYKVVASFFADNSYVHTDGTMRTRLTMDQAPAYYGATSYTITYENSRLDPATPIDLPLSPLYSSLSESFVFLSHNEYTLDRVEVTVSPRKIVADGEDYVLISLRSTDQYGNPKPGAAFTLSSSFGTLADASITTDRDGYASTVLTAAGSSGSTTGTLTVSGAVSANVTFEIEPATADQSRVVAIAVNDRLPANGQASNMIVGRVENTTYGGVAGATINWKKARSLYELFAVAAPVDDEPDVVTTYSHLAQATPVAPPVEPIVLDTEEFDEGSTHYVVVTSLEADPDNPSGSSLITFTTSTLTLPDQPYSGSVVTDANGNFEIGPFIASGPETPGYWFVSVALADDSAGDVVFWNEYPDTNYGPVPGTNLPQPSVQALAGDATPYAYTYQFPSYYDEATPYAPATPVTTVWLPPNWFAMAKYTQYQLGLLGAVRGQVTYGPDTHAFRKVI